MHLDLMLTNGRVAEADGKVGGHWSAKIPLIPVHIGIIPQTSVKSRTDRC